MINRHPGACRYQIASRRDGQKQMSSIREQPAMSIQCIFTASERLLVVHLALGRDLKALLCAVQDGLDLLDEPVLLLLDLGVLLDRVLNQQLNVPQLAKVKVALALQTDDRLLERRVLLRQRGVGLGDAQPRPGSARRRRGAARSPGRAACHRSASSSPTTAAARRTEGSALSPRDGVVLAARVVLVPETLYPLQELEVVLHLALDETCNGDGFVDLVLGKCVWVEIMRSAYVCTLVARRKSQVTREQVLSIS